MDTARLAFSAVAVFIAAVAVALLCDDKLEATEAIGLLGLVVISVFLAVGGERLIRRITKFGPVEFELAPEERDDIKEITGVAEQPYIESYFSRFLPSEGSESSGEEWPPKPKKLSETQRWYYEVGTDLVLHLDHRGLKVRQLSEDDREVYRRLVLWLAKAALSEATLLDIVPVKPTELLKKLDPLEEKTAEELLYIGFGYLTMAPHLEREDDRREYLERSQVALEEAIQKLPNRAETHLLLGYVYDELRYYELAISANDEAVRIDKRWALIAYWNRAVSNLNLGNQEAALEDLRKIGEGPWWQGICDDPELAPLNEGEYAIEFEKLCRDNSA